jgi:hypothetical protein
MIAQMAIPMYRNPILEGERRIAAACLYHWLMERNYAQSYREAICRHAVAEGTLAGLPDGHLDPEDVAAAEQVLVDGFEPVSYDSPEWGTLEDLDDLDAILEPPGADAPDDRWFHPSRDVLKAAGLAPIAGGAPTEADRRDFESWLASVDADYPPDDQVEPAGIFSPELMEDLYGIDAGRYA